jgi:hypothetical protein
MAFGIKIYRKIHKTHTMCHCACAGVTELRVPIRVGRCRRQTIRMWLPPTPKFFLGRGSCNLIIHRQLQVSRGFPFNSRCIETRWTKVSTHIGDTTWNGGRWKIRENRPEETFFFGIPLSSVATWPTEVSRRKNLSYIGLRWKIHNFHQPGLADGR